MSYKTFEDMRHDIPEGATHYSIETEELHFAWRRANGDSQVPDVDKEWCPESPVRDWVEIPDEQAQDWNGEGLPPVEWRNGDECIYKSNGAVVVGWHPIHPVLVVDSSEFGLVSCALDELSRPETPQQREERWRLESAYDLYCEFTNSNSIDSTCMSEFVFRISPCLLKWLSIVDKTGYRKAK